MKKIALLGATSPMFALPSAHASLTPFQAYTGNYGYSADGFGSTAQNGAIPTLVPLGSRLVAAYLYTSTNIDFSSAGKN